MKDKSTYFNTSLVVLFALFVVVLIIYTSIHSAITPKTYYTNTVDERIQPIGNVYVEGDIDVNVAPVPVVASAAARSGEAVYSGACSACHAVGVAGAPKYGDKVAWAPRLEQGLAALVSSVTNGKGAMPPKGACGDCSSAELEASVNYLLDSVK